jgi:co-chaperonin GroES (HSP10)
MKIRPLNDRVLVIREEEEPKTVGGITCIYERRRYIVNC